MEARATSPGLETAGLECQEASRTPGYSYPRLLLWNKANRRANQTRCGAIAGSFARGHYGTDVPSGICDEDLRHSATRLQGSRERELEILTDKDILNLV